MRLVLDGGGDRIHHVAHGAKRLAGGVAHLAAALGRRHRVHRIGPVSYTHLDVYKRQAQRTVMAREKRRTGEKDKRRNREFGKREEKADGFSFEKGC